MWFMVVHWFLSQILSLQRVLDSNDLSVLGDRISSLFRTIERNDWDSQRLDAVEEVFMLETGSISWWYDRRYYLAVVDHSIFFQTGIGPRFHGLNQAFFSADMCWSLELRTTASGVVLMLCLMDDTCVSFPRKIDSKSQVCQQPFLGCQFSSFRADPTGRVRSILFLTSNRKDQQFPCPRAFPSNHYCNVFWFASSCVLFWVLTMCNCTLLRC